MNTNTPAHKAKIRHLCCFLVLCLHLACGAVPGPCKHSVTKEHLLYLRRLIGNQLQNGCSISYNFTERQSLSEVCYIKAALPHLLELLNAHFRYGRDSDNYNYAKSLKTLIYNIYSQKCVLPINEEIEDSPVKFAKLHMTSPRVGLEKAEEVLQMYKNLVTTTDQPIKWNCEDEYAEDHPDSTTAQTSGTQECQCPCTKISSTLLRTSVQIRSTSSAPRSSPAPVLRHKNEGHSETEHVFKQGTFNSIKIQPSPVSLSSETSPGRHTRTELYGSTPGDFTHIIMSSTPHLLDTPIETARSPSQAMSSTTRKPQRRTALTVQSAPSRPVQRNVPQRRRSGRGARNVLSKRSLDTKVGGGLFDMSSDLIQSWITTTTTNNPVQTLHVDRKTAPKSATPPLSLNITEDISDNVIPPAEQTEDLQTHLHMAASPPEHGIKTISEESDCKDFECQKDTEATNDQISKHPEAEYWVKNIQLSSSSIKTTVLIISVCFILLLLSTLTFSKQRTNISTPALKTNKKNSDTEVKHLSRIQL
uniref:Colony stimulating factor 1a (macrophage) n=1 Tax=Astyanax mexicanus TaxID=7994 RepID=A0A3B1K623_ASTMX